MSGTKNDGEFEFDIQKLKKWVFLVGWRAKPENEQQIFRFSRFSRCENQYFPRKFQGSLQTNRMGISASMSVMRCNAREKETKTFPVFSTGKLLFQLACSVHAAAGFESRLAAIFFFGFFGFSSFSHCVGAFFEFFFYQHRAKRAPCLPRKFDTAESLCQAVNRFFDYEFFEGRMTSFFCIFAISMIFYSCGYFFQILKKSCTKLATIEKVLPKSRNFAFFRGGWATLVVKFENYMQKAL